jgi:hypothetical protein
MAAFSWKALIPFMVKDIEDLMEAVERFQNMDTDFSPGYRLIRLNVTYARCLRGISLLEQSKIKYQSDLSTEQPHPMELLAQMQEACTLAGNLFSDPSSSLTETASLFHREAELWERVDDLQKAFDRFVLDCAGSGDSDDEDILDEIKNQGQDVVLQFSELFSVAHEPLSVFKGTAAFNAWQSHFAGVEKQFQSRFDCFAILDDLWDRFRLYEYFADFWWLNTSPGTVSSEIQETTISPEALVSSLATLYKKDRHAAGPCPDFEMIAAFANDDDIDHEIKTAIQQHILHCDQCREEVEDIRQANMEAELGLDTPLYGYQHLWDDILESMISKHPERYVKLQPDTTLDFDLGAFPSYVRAVEPFKETMQRMHSSDISLSETIIGFVRWLKHGKEYGRAWVNAKLLFQDFDDGVLTISGSLQDDFADLIPKVATWHCKWETDENGAGIDPDTFDYDYEKGLFTVDFSMAEKKKGRFIIWFDVLFESD